MRYAFRHCSLFCLLALLLMGCAKQAVTPRGTVVPLDPTTAPVQVTLTESAIQASTQTFEAGIPYQFIILNAGPQPRAFVFGVADGGRAGLAEISAALLPPGGSVTLTLAFPTAAAGQRLTLYAPDAGLGASALQLPITID